jgi:hypothetical protein
LYSDVDPVSTDLSTLLLASATMAWPNTMATLCPPAGGPSGDSSYAEGP